MRSDVDGDIDGFVAALFASAPSGMGIWSADLRFVAVNDSLAAINGVPAASHPGRTPRELLGDLGIHIEQRLRRALRDRSPLDVLERGATPALPGAERAWQVTYFPIRVPGHARPGVGATVVDVTDRLVAEKALRDSEERFRLLVEGVRDYAIMMLDSGGRVASWNVGAQRILGYDPAEIMGREHAAFWPAELVPEGPRQLLARAARHGNAEAEGWRVRRDGSRFWSHVVLTAIHDSHGAVRGYSKVVRDLTEQRAVEQALRESESLLRSVVESAPDGVLVVDGDGKLLAANPRAEEMFGYARGELLGQPVERLVPERLRDVHRGYRRGYLEQPHTRPMGALLDLTAQRKDGSEFPVEIGLGAMDADGGLTRVTAVVTDVTARRAAEEALVHQATHDALTGLPNRVLFVDRLRHALEGLARRGAGGVAVLFCDLDRFKVVNDSLGHDAGDALLRTVAHRLRSLLRPSDTVARFGGDEFVVLVESLDAMTDGQRVADRLLAAFIEPIDLGVRQVVVTPSVGIAIADDPSVEPEVLLRDADAAMYRAKERGRGRVELFDETLRTQVVERLDLEHGLRRALTDGDLGLAFQPIVSLRTGAITGVEALARWSRADGRAVPPSRFIPVAEETGLIVPLGTHVLRAASRALAGWRAAGLVVDGFTLSVNVSVHQLADSALGSVIAEVLAAEGVEPPWVQLEITESVAFGDDHSTAALEQLQRLGVRLAIDDFGTGHSSLSRLRQLSVDTLKIDRSFVDGLGREAGDSAVVEAIVRLAQAYGIDTVAEGVEEPHQRDALLQLGCARGQGFLLGRPVDEATMTGLLGG